MTMENRGIGLSQVRSQSVLRKYHQLTSPLVSLQSAKRQDLLKEEIRQNVTMRLDCIKNRGSKIYALDTSITFPQLKAAATLYQIPEFSVPEVNFEVSEQIKRKVDEARREIISSLPEISKSSNYAPRKIEHQLSQRTAVRELEQWLGQKLRCPPTNAEQSIQYKNMIMGVGMKELIRLIGKRCAEQGRMAEEIWELTWSICREIILYLSKRAKKCEQLLQEELQFMRTSYEKEFQRLTAENNRMTAQHQSLKQEHAELQTEVARLRKRREGLQQQNKSLGFDNQHLQQQFKKVLQQNLAIYLQIGDKSKRGWVKKLYKNISALGEDTDSTIKSVFKKQVVEVVEDRNKLEEVTGDSQEILDAELIQEIANEVLQRSAGKKHRRSKKQKKPRKSKQVTKANKSQSVNEDKTMIAEAQNKQVVSEAESQLSEPSCADLINHLREQFLPVDAEIQTDAKQLIDAYASTAPKEFAQQQTNVDSTCLGFLQEIGVNTEQPKQEAKLGKKKGKQNSKEQPRKEKSKIFNAPPLREKSKPKGDGKEKDRKPTLDVVQELNLHHEDSQLSEKDQSVSAINQQLIAEVIPSKSDLEQLDGKEFHKKISLFAPVDLPEPTIKTNSAIYSSSFALQVKQKVAAHLLPQKQKKKGNIKQLQQSVSAQPTLTAKNFDKQENLSILCEEREKQGHSISCDGDINRFKEDPKIRLSECSLYICAQCNKIINTLEECYQYPKNRLSQLDKNSIYQEKRSARASPMGSIKGLSLNKDQNDEETMGEKRSSGMKRVRRQNKKNSSYIHDIAFKKDLEEQQQQGQGLLTPFKISFCNNSKDEAYEDYEEGEENEPQQPTLFSKMAPYVLFFSQMLDSNKSLVQAIVNAPQQQAQNLQHYFQLVREINALPEGKVMTEKSAISIIEKTLFPILSELIAVVKKAVKGNRIADMMRLFTSLPSIVYTRITRKYGVKILAIKNLKVLLMALRQAGKFTDKYKIIQLMMFTDCKSPHSEDLFMYLLAMALFDPSFSATRFLPLEDTRTLRTLCEDYLSRDVSLYGQFEKVGNEGGLLTTLLKGVVTSYRLLKINRIEEVGFVYLMLKKDHHMSYKKFICFLTTLALPHNTKFAIAKKMLQFCDIRIKDRIAISEIMFSKFLIYCQDFSYKLLEDTINRQLQGYRHADHEKDIVSHLSSKFFKTQKYIRTKFDFQDQKNKNLLQPECPRDSIAVEQDESIISGSGDGEQQSQKVNESVTVATKIKEYSSFTYQVCKYLQNGQETKYLTQRQQLFVKNYLIVHIIQAEIEKTMGLVDYFSNSMLPILKTPTHQIALK